MSQKNRGPASNDRGPIDISQCRNNRSPQTEEQALASDAITATSDVGASILLNEIASRVTDLVSLPDGAAKTVALWVFFAACHNAFETSPRLALQSPVPGCGKTTLLGVIEALAPNAVAVSNTTPAVVFRLIADRPVTLLVDEIDSMIGTRTELINVFNSGHSRSAANIARCAGEDYKPKIYSTWAPTVLAGIGSLPDALQSRCIVIAMQRAKPSEQLRRFKRQDRLELNKLGLKIQTWARAHMGRLEAADPEMPEGFYGRLADNWRPLFAVADQAGGDWPAEARSAARSLTGEIEVPAELTLLEACMRAVTAIGLPRIPTKLLWNRLARIDDDLEEPLISSPKDLATRLRPFGIKPTRPFKYDGKTQRGYEAKAFYDAAERYLDGNWKADKDT